MKQYCITVSGKVQGVSYRQSAQQEALRLGLRGFVRNESNGDVYIEVAGSKKSLDRFVEWCRKGPPRAVVTHIKITEPEPINFSSFEIRK